MRGKRGDVELQFNWMFVFIVGTLILAVAAGFVIKQKKNSDIIISSQIIHFTRSIIALSSATPGKAEPQTLQKSIGVSCDPKGCSASGCASDFYVQPRTLNAKIDTKIETIFSPSTIKGNELGTWSLEWDMPYHISNFLYITSDQVRYIFVQGGGSESDGLIEELYSEMPDIMGNKEKVAGIAGIKDRNNYKVRLVFVGQEPGQVPLSLSKMPNADVSAVQILPSDGEDFGIGTLKFYKKSGSKFVEQTSADEVYFFGKPAVYGAIFSENKEIYECNMYKAFLRLNATSQLYIGKLDFLLTMSSEISNTDCHTIYTSAQAKITELSESMALDDEPPEIDAHGMYGISKEISRLNDNLKLKSCPQIY